MAGESKSTKDKMMAAYMKAKGITRTVANCPVCHKQVSLRSMYNHILSCRR